MKNKLLKRANSGFSLVELIVVIAIMAILVGVAVPVYSSYIEKANAAKDEQLLGEINSAFAVVCAGNAIDINTVTEANIPVENGVVNLAGMTVKVNGTAKDGIGAAMVGILGNDLEFNTIEALLYNKAIHAFEAVTAQAYAMYLQLKGYGTQIDLLMGSNLGALGAETLLTEMGTLVDWANNIGLIGNAGAAFYKAYMGYLGIDYDAYIDPTTGEPYADKLEELENAMETAIAALGGDAQKVQANAIALYAAQNSAGVQSGNVSAWLGGNKSAGDIQNSSSGTTLGEAAAIYALWMSYQGDNFDNHNGDTLLVMGDALSDEGDFKTWVESDEGQKELEAFKAAMEIVGATDGDDEARNAILANGFADPELIKVMESLMGK